MDSSYKFSMSLFRAWPSGYSPGFEIRRLRVQIPFWPLADVVLGSPEFNFSASLVNSQLACLPPVGILYQVMFIWIFIYHCCLHWSCKAPMVSGQLRIHTMLALEQIKLDDFSVQQAEENNLGLIHWFLHSYFQFLNSKQFLKIIYLAVYKPKGWLYISYGQDLAAVLTKGKISFAFFVLLRRASSAPSENWTSVRISFFGCSWFMRIDW